MNIRPRPEGAIDRSGIIKTVQQWDAYRDKKVIDCYSVIEDGETVLKVVTLEKK